MERVILPDCCEDWILGYGAFYEKGARFDCIECSNQWTKLEPGRYENVDSGQVWAEQVRSSEGHQFRFLEAEGSERALTNRCCAKLILDYGDRIRMGREFTCPICGTGWKKEQVENRAGLLVACFLNKGRGNRLAVQPGIGRSYLVPFEEYSPAR